MIAAEPGALIESSGIKVYAHVTGRSSILPSGPRPVAEKRSTSPVRASSLPPSIKSSVAGNDLTVCEVSLEVPSVDAVRVTVPSECPVIAPYASTDATVGSEVVHVNTGAGRLVPSAWKATG